MEHNASQNLTGLCERMHADSEVRMIELTEKVSELQKLLHEATEKNKDLETKYKQLKADHEGEIEQPNKIISKLNSDLHDTNELVHSQNLAYAHKEVSLGCSQVECKRLRDSEIRWRAERDVLILEKQHLERIKATIECNETESRLRFETRLDELSTECAALQRSLKGEKDRVRELSSHLKKQTETAKEKTTEEKDPKTSDELITLRKDLSQMSEERSKAKEELSFVSKEKAKIGEELASKEAELAYIVKIEALIKKIARQYKQQYEDLAKQGEENKKNDSKEASETLKQVEDWKPLQSERDTLAKMLTAEKETVKKLQNEFQEFRNEKTKIDTILLAKHQAVIKKNKQTSDELFTLKKDVSQMSEERNKTKEELSFVNTEKTKIGEELASKEAELADIVKREALIRKIARCYKQQTEKNKKIASEQALLNTEASERLQQVQEKVTAIESQLTSEKQENEKLKTELNTIRTMSNDKEGKFKHDLMTANLTIIELTESKKYVTMELNEVKSKMEAFAQRNNQKEYDEKQIELSRQQSPSSQQPSTETPTEDPPAAAVNVEKSSNFSFEVTVIKEEIIPEVDEPTPCSKPNIMSDDEDSDEELLSSVKKRKLEKSCRFC